MPRLIIMSRNGSGRQVDLSPGITTIGRDPSSRIWIDSERVSRRHATIERVGDRFVVMDLDSRNGTYVNDEPVADLPLCNGDAITVGDHQIRFLYSHRLQLPGDALRLLTMAGDLSHGGWKRRAASYAATRGERTFVR